MPIPPVEVPSEWLCESSMRWFSAGQTVILARALPEGMWGVPETKDPGST